MPRVRAGDLRHRVEVQTRAVTQDTFGDSINTWSFENHRWASIRQLTARELEIHSRPEAVATHRIQMRHYAGFSVTNRLLYKGRDFNVISSNDEWEKVHSTVLIVSEEVS